MNRKDIAHGPSNIRIRIVSLFGNISREVNLFSFPKSFPVGLTMLKKPFNTPKNLLFFKMSFCKKNKVISKKIY